MGQIGKADKLGYLCRFSGTGFANHDYDLVFLELGAMSQPEIGQG